mgnify:CR=1 FL=1
MAVKDLCARGVISIHAPHEGERPYDNLLGEGGLFEFQSTLPTRGSDAIPRWG